MPSSSLSRWQTERLHSLDEIVTAHRAVGGIGPGRRYATGQVNQAYAVLLSSQFQAFCRDLHSECVQHIALAAPTRLQNVLRGEFQVQRRLDRGNPTPGNIGEDFARIGLRIWDHVRRLDSRNGGRQQQLEDLNRWRNAIAHQDFDPGKLGGRTNLRLKQVSRWAKSCSQLAVAFDQVAGSHLHSLLGNYPW